MVTKKTRLLSAIMAAMMLVTMFTGIVLPATAVTPASDLPSMTEYHNSVAAGSALTGKEYTVSTLAELELLSVYQKTFVASYTVYFIDDIAIPTEGYVAGQASGTAGDANAMSSLQASLDGCYAEGGRATISGIRVAQNWLGTYNNGVKIANLNFDDCKATATTNGGALLFGNNGTAVVKTFENLTFTNCSVEKGTGSNNLSLICGKTNGAASFFRNIRVENCSLIDHTNYTTGPCNIAFLQAATQYSVTLEDIYLINNTIDIDWMDNSLGVAIGELTQASADVAFNATNVAVIGTTLNVTYEGKYGGSAGNYGMNSTLGALVGGLANYTMKQDGEGKPLCAATIDNILVYGNNKGDTAFNSVISGCAIGTAAGDIPIKATNVSTDLPKIVRDTIYDAQNTGSSYKSVYVQKLTTDSTNNTVNDTGSLIDAACKLNEASTEKVWGIRDGALDFIKDGEKAAKKVTVEIRNPEDLSLLESTVDYTGVDGMLLRADEYADKADLWTEDPATAVIAETVVTGYVIPEHTCELEYTYNDGGTHRYACVYEWTVADVGTVRCAEGGEAECDYRGWKTVTSVDTEEPDANHIVVIACSLCGHSFREYGTFKCDGELTVTSLNPATSCKPEGAGSVVTSCTVCDYSHTGIILGDDKHQWDAYVERTDLPKYHQIYCSVCGETEGDLEKHEDHFGEWQVTTPPDVDNEGVETRTCVCGKTETRAVAKLPGIKLEAEKAKVGNTFEVKVNLANNPGVGGMMLELTYDASILTLTGAKQGDWQAEFVKDGLTDVSGVVTKKVHIVGYDDMTADGAVLILVFEVKNDENLTNEQTDITVRVGNAYSYDDLKQEIVIEGYASTITIHTGLVKGDLSGDKFVNLQDAIYLLRYLSRPEGATSWEMEVLIDGVPTTITITDKMANLTTENDNVDLGDETNNGDVNISDVIYLLKYLNFQITDAEFFGE